MSSNRTRATVGVDQANVDTAEINLGYCHIKAPVSGRAGTLLVDLGNLVEPGSGSAATAASGTSAQTGTTTSTNATAAAGTGGSTGLVSISQIKPIYVSFPTAQTELDAVKAAQAKAPLEVDGLFAGRQADR